MENAFHRANVIRIIDITRYIIVRRIVDTHALAL